MNAAEAEEFVTGDSIAQASPADDMVETPLDEAAGASKAIRDGKGKKRAISSEVEDESGWDVVYSDGACKGNGKPGSIAGIGVWWGNDGPRSVHLNIYPIDILNRHKEYSRTMPRSPDKQPRGADC